MALLLYIHGFLSSPHSHKAQQVESWLKDNRLDIDYACPTLTAYPDHAIACLQDIVEQHSPEPVYLLGSSLGGYYATYLAEKYNLRAVLINPAVKPYRLISDYLNQDLKNYHTEDHYRLERRHIEVLRALETDRLQYPANYWLLVQTADETLDYRDAVNTYRGCRQTVERGGDHGFQGFERWLPDIIRFFTAP
ncbi:MAG: YqiA/YcfP family alpha/beta fold hydrolase [Cellvibrionaceae bacterium]